MQQFLTDIKLYASTHDDSNNNNKNIARKNQTQQIAEIHEIAYVHDDVNKAMISLLLIEYWTLHIELIADHHFGILLHLSLVAMNKVREFRFICVFKCVCVRWRKPYLIPTIVWPPFS